MARHWMYGALVGTLLTSPLAVQAAEQAVPAPAAPAPATESASKTEEAPKLVQMAQATKPQSDSNAPDSKQALPPLPDDLPPAVRAYLEALQKEVVDLRAKVNQGANAQPVTPAGAIPAPGAPPVAPPVPSARTLVAPLASRLQFSGYAELRITNLGNAVGDRLGPHDNLDFQVNRFRPRLTYFMDPNWEADLQINVNTRGAATTSFQARDAYIEYHNGKNNQYAVRLGQQKVPFGFETWIEGDEPRPALERARYHEVLFPDQRDIGLGITFNPRELPLAQAQLHGPLYGIGVYSGNGINKQDNDQNKTVVAGGRYAISKHVTVGLSGVSGTFSPAVGHTNTRQAGNVDVETFWGRFRTQTEVMVGRNLGHDINGGYGQLEYATGIPGSFFVRYDWFDRNESVGHDYWKRYGFGWYKDFTKNIRLTAEYDYVVNQLTQTRHPNTFGLELQANW